MRMQVLPRKSPVPTVGHDPTRGLGIVAPCERGLVEPSARGMLPLGLGGEAYARPVGVRHCILVRHVHNRMQLPPMQGRARPLRMPPLRPRDPTPPPGPVVKWHRTCSGGEDERAGRKLALLGV